MERTGYCAAFNDVTSECCRRRRQPEFTDEMSDVFSVFRHFDIGVDLQSSFDRIVWLYGVQFLFEGVEPIANIRQELGLNIHVV